MTSSQIDSIITLGKFDVIRDGVSLVAKNKGAKKLWELYQFMLSNKDKEYSPEAIMNHLWVEEEYSDPRSTLRRQMFRLRTLLGEEHVDDDKQSILFVNGYYQWNYSLKVQIDSDLFIEYIKQGESFKGANNEKALVYYEKALELYQSDYLPQCDELHWVFPIRNRLRHLYVDTVIETSAILKDQQNFQKIIKIVEKAIQIDMFEEAFHYILIESMMLKGEYKRIIDYYKFVVTQYKNEMGVEPSNELKTLYKHVLQSHQYIDETQTLFDAFETKEVVKNAYECEPDIFRSILELEIRKCEREGMKASVCVLSNNNIDIKTFSQKENFTKHLKKHLMQHLRKGDALTVWNNEQIVVLLAGIDQELMKQVIDRVLQKDEIFPHVTVSQVSDLNRLNKARI